MKLLKILKHYEFKESFNKKSQATDWKIVFAIHISDKGLASTIYKEELKLKNKKTTQF